MSELTPFFQLLEAVPENYSVPSMPINLIAFFLPNKEESMAIEVHRNLKKHFKEIDVFAFDSMSLTQLDADMSLMLVQEYIPDATEEYIKFFIILKLHIISSEGNKTVHMLLYSDQMLLLKIECA